MSKSLKILDKAIDEALKSTQTFKHGAVVTGPGRKIICSGFNKGNRTKILNKVFTCTHAEMDVLNKLINNYLKPKYGKKYRDYIGKYSLWVTRIENDRSCGIKTTYSKPCYYCFKELEDWGIKKIYYTVDNTTTVCCKVSELNSTHKSDCQIKSEQVDTNIKLKQF